MIVRSLEKGAGQRWHPSRTLSRRSPRGLEPKAGDTRTGDENLNNCLRAMDAILVTHSQATRIEQHDLNQFIKTTKSQMPSLLTFPYS
jgi:hypothetical protein